MQKNACSVSLSLRKQRLTAIIFCLLSAFTLPVPLQAGVPQQQSTYPVKGLVTDAKGVPLPGVTVRYGITGGVTDNGGRFSIRLPSMRWLRRKERTAARVTKVTSKQTLNFPNSRL